MNGRILLACSRYCALAAVGLAIGEAVINWGHWQYAPLWIIDYVIAAWLVYGFYKTQSGGSLHTLMNAWVFTAGIFYIAFFVSLDPGLKTCMQTDPLLLGLIGFMLCVSIGGFLCCAFIRPQPAINR
ncbi:MAG TPA: hypothetical protein VGL10_05005 [Gammaproteobacteria bacterium]